MCLLYEYSLHRYILVCFRLPPNVRARTLRAASIFLVLMRCSWCVIDRRGLSGGWGRVWLRDMRDVDYVARSSGRTGQSNPSVITGDHS